MYVLILLAAIMLAGALPAHAWKQDHFVVTVWGPAPVTDEWQAVCKDEGYTLSWASAGNLDIVQKAGLKALLSGPLLEDPKVLDNPEQKARLDALIDGVKKHPAMWAYYLVDEPGATAFEDWGRMAAYVRERDPDHLVWINLYPTYASLEQLNISASEIAKKSDIGDQIFMAGAGDAASQQRVAAYREYLRKYVEVVKPDMISYDHYTFFKERDGTQFFLNLELVREAALKANVPFMNIVQSCAYFDDWRIPSKQEMRLQVYSTMAYGGRGISYFKYHAPAHQRGLYRDGVRSSLALDVAALNKEMGALGPELMKLGSVGIYHTEPIPSGARAVPADCPIQIQSQAPCVLGLFTDRVQPNAFMVVNRDCSKPARVRLTMARGITGLREFDRKTRKWVGYWTAKNGQTASVELQPGDGRLFRMVER